MKKTIQIITTVTLIVAILFCSVWYLFVYDRDFTRDLLLTCARTSENHNQHALAAWFYDLAYTQSDNSDAVAVELAQQYKNSGNYTKAEFTLYNAISDGGGIDVYIALSKLYVEQDKLLDAVTMLGSVTDTQIKQQLDALRPVAPISTPDPGFYNQYISVTLNTSDETVYFSTDGEFPSTQSEPYSEPIMLVNGENTISALAVNDKGLVSTLSTVGYTVGGVIELVEFNDPAIEKEVRSLLGFKDDAEIYTSDLWTITEFTMPDGAEIYTDIKHLAFLKKLSISSGQASELSNISGLTNLTELSITNTAVSQDVLESIAKLPFLSKLTLSNCSLSGIAPLAAASGLSVLDLSNNAIRDISSISSMASLQELYLQHNAVTDLSAISEATALTILNVSHNSLTTLAPLASLTALTQLDANTNNLTELGNLNKLMSLTTLSLASNKLTGITQLSACSALTDLDISSNQLTNISSLSSLSGLTALNFSHNQVTDLPKWDTSCALVTIDGSYNHLSSVDALAGLEHLNVIKMDYNESIKSIDRLAECPMLLRVDVYGTSVTDVRKLKAQSIVVNYNPVQ